MASVVKKGKRYYAVFYDHAHKQKWVKGYTDKGETKRLGEKLENEQRRIKLGDVDPQVDARRKERSKPASDHVAAFKVHLTSKAREAKHIQYSIRDIERCVAFTKITHASQLTLPLVDKWREWCLNTGYPTSEGGKARPDSNRTSNRRIVSVKSWLRYLRRIGAVETLVLDEMTLLPLLGFETFHRRSLSRDEVELLLTKTPNPSRRELYRFAIFAGFRQGEIRSMTPANFDFVAGNVTVFARDAKSRKDQSIPLHPTLMEPLKKLCEGKLPDEPVFRVPHNQLIVGLLHDDCRVAGIDVKNVDFHGLRHTFCSLLVEAGCRSEVLFKLARHRDLATTLKHYVHLKSDDLRESLERL